MQTKPGETGLVHLPFALYSCVAWNAFNHVGFALVGIALILTDWKILEFVPSLQKAT
jgi:hypothetical protein